MTTRGWVRLACFGLLSGGALLAFGHLELAGFEIAGAGFCIFIAS